MQSLTVCIVCHPAWEDGRYTPLSYPFMMSLRVVQEISRSPAQLVSA